MLRALEDGRGADLIGRARGRNRQADVAVAVVHYLVDGVMQKADADAALPRTHVLGGAGARLRVHRDVLVEVDEVLDAIVQTILLDDGVQHELGGTCGVVI